MRTHRRGGPPLGTRTMVLCVREHVGGSAQVTSMAGLSLAQLSSGGLEGPRVGRGRVLKSCCLELRSSGEARVLPRAGQGLRREPGDIEAEAQVVVVVRRAEQLGEA